MSMLIAAFMFMPLLAMTIAHFLWAAGRTWPIRDPQLLAETVIGRPGVARVPALNAFARSAFFLVTGILALALADHDSGGPLLTLAGLPVAALFLARGFIGYTKQWAARTPLPNFRVNDQRVYSPLSLFLGTGFVVLIVLRLF